MKKTLLLLVTGIFLPVAAMGQSTTIVPIPQTGGPTPASPGFRPLPAGNPELSEQVITLPEAIELGYRQNPVMEAQRRAVEAALFRKKSAWGSRLPQLSVAAAYTYMDKDIDAFNFNSEKDRFLEYLGQAQLPIQIPPEMIETIQGLDLKWTLQKQQFAVVGASAVMPLYMGGRINAAVNAQKIGIQKSDAQTEKVRVDLFAEIVERYYGLALAQQVYQVRKEVTEGMRKHLHDARKMEENGMIARTESLYAEMFMAKAEGEEKTAELSIGTVNKALSASLNQPGRYIPITALFVVDSLLPVSYYQERTKANSPMLKQVELTRRLAKEGVRAARANFLPEIAAVGAINAWNYNLTDLAPKWAVGATAKLRIFDGLGSEHKHTAAKREVLQVEAMQIKAENDLMTLVEQVYNQLKSSAVAVHALGASVKFAEAYLDAKLKAFSEGFAPSSDVVDARLNLAGVKVQRLAAAYAFNVALAQMLALAGETETFGDFPYQSDYQIVNNE